MMLFASLKKYVSNHACFAPSIVKCGEILPGQMRNGI
jgi:hypothetical protein